MADILTKQLGELTGVITTFKDNAWKTINGIQKQVDAIDQRTQFHHTGDSSAESLTDRLKSDEAIQRLMRDGRGHAVISFEGKDAGILDRKSTITSSGIGYSTTGVLQIDRMTGITAEARQVAKVRDMLTATPTNFQVIDYVKVNSPLANASPQVEGTTKFENAVTFTSLSERVKTIATFIKASRQILEDLTELAAFLRTGLSYYVDNAVDIELLSGSATGEHLNGLITQATSFSTGLLSATRGWNTMDIIGRAIQQVEESKEISPSFVVLHPRDWWGMRLTKDGFGRYILGDPQSTVRPTLFGRDVVSTTNIAAGTFLLGSGDPAAAEIRDRMQTTVDISTEDGTNFQQNLVTVRAECRLALVVRRPASFITGSFTSSPA